MHTSQFISSISCISSYMFRLVYRAIFRLVFSGLYGLEVTRSRITDSKVKAVPLQARRGPEGSGKLRLPDFVTTAQNGGRLSALRTGRLYHQEILLVLISLRG
jgi:hypothetical protein